MWGIIDAFHGLGTAGAATLRAVAPGISEALITTAAGLFAAIPAVIAYNMFTQHIREFGARMDDFSLELMNEVERAQAGSSASVARDRGAALMAFTNAQGRTQSSLADINVTPLVDVVLVLLIIFMVTAPVLQSGIEVAVPHTKTVKEITEERLVITIDREQHVFLNNEPVNINQIGANDSRQDSRSRRPVGLRARRRERALRRIRHGDGRGEAVRHHEREHRDPAAGEEWQPTLTSSRSETQPARPLIGSVALHVASVRAGALRLPDSQQSRRELGRHRRRRRRSDERDAGQQHSAAGRRRHDAKRAGQRVEGTGAVAAERDAEGRRAQGDSDSREDAKRKDRTRESTQKKPPPKQVAKVEEDNKIPFGAGWTGQRPLWFVHVRARPRAASSFSGGTGDFGSRFGWYVDGVRRKVSDNWLKYEIDPRIDDCAAGIHLL